MNLTEAKEGEEYIIKEILTDDEELTSFLFSLGCYSGEPITVVSHLKGGCVVSLRMGVIILILIWRKPFQYNKKIVVSTIFFAQRLVHTNKDKMRIIKDVEKEENYEDCFCRKSQQWKDDHVQCTYRQE